MQIECVIGAWSAAVRHVNLVDGQPDVPADAFHGHRVPVAVVDSQRVHANRSRAASAVKTILNEPVLQLPTTTQLPPAQLFSA